MKPVFRDVTLKDADDAFRLIVELGYPALARAEFDRSFPACVDGEGARVVVAEVDGRVMALATFNIRPQLRIGGPLMSIDEFVVEERVRGHGLGGEFLEYLVSIARAQGVLRVELHTRRTRESYVRGFYVKHGFIEADSAVMRRTL